MIVNILAERLKEADMTPEKFAEQSGISLDTINAWCNGTFGELVLSELYIMCKTLHCNISDLLVME